MYRARPGGGGSKLNVPAGSFPSGPVPVISPISQRAYQSEGGLKKKPSVKKISRRPQPDRSPVSRRAPDGAEPACSRSRPPCAGGQGGIVSQTSPKITKVDKCLSKRLLSPFSPTPHAVPERHAFRS